MKNGLVWWVSVLGIVTFVVAIFTSHRWQILASSHYYGGVVGVTLGVWALVFAFYTRQFWPDMGWKAFWITQLMVAIGIGYGLELGFRLVNCALDSSPPLRETLTILDYKQYKAERSVLVQPSFVGARINVFVPRKVYETFIRESIAVRGGMAAELTYQAGRLGVPWCGADAIQPKR